jgi:predicted metallopeptidase
MKELFSTKIVKFVKNTTIMTAVVNKDSIRKLLKDLVIEEPLFVAELMSELDSDLKNSKKIKLAAIVKEVFEEYGEVFKALA